MRRRRAVAIASPGLAALAAEAPPPASSYRQARSGGRIAAVIDPKPQLHRLRATERADVVEFRQHRPRARHVALQHLQLTVVLGGAPVVGIDGQRLLVEVLGLRPVTLLAPDVTLVR